MSRPWRPSPPPTEQHATRLSPRTQAASTRGPTPFLSASFLPVLRLTWVFALCSLRLFSWRGGSCARLVQVLRWELGRGDWVVSATRVLLVGCLPHLEFITFCGGFHSASVSAHLFGQFARYPEMHRRASCPVFGYTISVCLSLSTTNDASPHRPSLSGHSRVLLRAP